ncbi:predicted protein [Sclerotinia sclerotiorum 1980 UF-70]|uniref:Uncharacterized protein n=2 Tax=Sclerotinia sclerotiorum (strain ATCC 18683 / 1980 / Ss-1) TaxID=665079 RepID=A7ERJ7_SCLS1|nr:predicted protein [Sclerotinia sclerotiorum 1980 UF-70]APA13441.1 hypothetical protein sscle_11g082110 [Sclerotinia sclerotiorum 1980 UF-70]EDN92089.1 predicted protein [Sclerotinia sclerotiorum 1980 UF-70]
MSRAGNFVEGLDHHAYRTGQSDFAGEDQPHRGQERVYEDPYSDRVLDTRDTDLDPFHDTPSGTSYVGGATQYSDPQDSYSGTTSRRQAALQASLSPTNSGSTFKNSYSGAGYQETPPSISVTESPPITRQASLQTVKSQSYLSPADPTGSLLGSGQTFEAPPPTSVHYTGSRSSAPKYVDEFRKRRKKRGTRIRDICHIGSYQGTCAMGK